MYILKKKKNLQTSHKKVVIIKKFERKNEINFLEVKINFFWLTEKFNLFFLLFFFLLGVFIEKIIQTDLIFLLLS